MEFKDVIAEIITGLENGSFTAGAGEGEWAKGDEDFQDAVDMIAEILADKEFTKWHLLAAETHIRDTKASVRVDEVEDYLDNCFLHSGATVGSTLESYASNDEIGEIGRLYQALDTAGGVDRFDWSGHADDGMTTTSGMLFVTVPAPTGEDSVFLFQNGR